jgi:hypothetical protein
MTIPLFPVEPLREALPGLRRAAHVNSKLHIEMTVDVKNIVRIRSLDHAQEVG